MPLFLVPKSFINEQLEVALKAHFDNLIFLEGSSRFTQFMDKVSELGFDSDSVFFSRVYFSDTYSDISGIFSPNIQSISCLKVGGVGATKASFFENELFLHFKKSPRYDLFFVTGADCINNNYSVDFDIICISERAMERLSPYLNGVRLKEMQSNISDKFYALVCDESLVATCIYEDLGFSSAKDGLFIDRCIEVWEHIDATTFHTSSSAYWVKKSYWVQGNQRFYHNLYFSSEMMKLLHKSRPKLSGFKKTWLNSGQFKIQLPNVCMPIWDEVTVTIEKEALKRRVALVRSQIGADWATEPFMQKRKKKTRSF